MKICKRCNIEVERLWGAKVSTDDTDRIETVAKNICKKCCQIKIDNYMRRHGFKKAS